MNQLVEQLVTDMTQKKRNPSEISHARILALKVVVPRKLKICSTLGLKLMLVSIRNIIAVCTVYMYRIERELGKRKSNTSILLETEIGGETIDFATIK